MWALIRQYLHGATVALMSRDIGSWTQEEAMGGPPTRGDPEMVGCPAPADQRLSGISNRDCYGRFRPI